MIKNKSNTVQKLVSVFILWCMVAGGIIGMLTAQVGSGADQAQPAPMIVPMVIDDEIFTIENWGVYDADFSISIQNGGTLRVVDSTLNFLQNTTRYSINVNDGTLILEGSTITTGATPMAAWDPLFNITLENGSTLIMENSVLAFPGQLNVADSTVYINDSWITSLTPDDFYTPYADQFLTFKGVVESWWPTGALTKDLDDGPQLSFNGSEVSIADSRIDELYENTDDAPDSIIIPFPPLTASGAAGSVNDIITAYDSQYMYVVPDFPPGSGETLSVETFNTAGYNDNDYAVDRVNLYVLYNTIFNGVDGYDSADMLRWGLEGEEYYNLSVLQATTIDEINYILPITPTISDIAQSNVLFTNTDPDMNATVYFDQILIIATLHEKNNPLPLIHVSDTEMTIINSFVSVDWLNAAGNYGIKNAFDLTSDSELYLYNVSFSEDNDNNGTIDFKEVPILDDPLDYVDYMPIRVGTDCLAYFFKWQDALVVDKYGLPVPGANVTSEFHSADATQVALVSSINDHSGGDAVTDYLERKYGVTAADFNVTGSNGKVMLPLLTTFLNATNYPNGDDVGEYDVSVAYVGGYDGYAVCDFKPFPNILPQENVVSTLISLDGLSLPRPIGSPGLVVNANTGNVFIGVEDLVNERLDVNDFLVVEDGFTLHLANINLKMLNPDTAPFEIIVRDAGSRLILDNVTMTTQDSTPITMSLQAGTSLIMNSSSTTPSISIQADGNANATFNKATLGGWFGTGPDADVDLWAYSTSFAQSLDTFTGTSVGHMIGCYSPMGTVFTIAPTEDAKVWVYRWAEITVNGGLVPANKLENAYVWINSTLPLAPAILSLLDRNGMTDSNGLFRVPLLSDYVQYDYTVGAAVPTPYNNYDVDVLYIGHVLIHTDTINLGLYTYSDRINTQAEATAARAVTLENVLPDLVPYLTIAPLAANNTVGRGNPVWINATINNVGDAKATNVLVRFMDNHDGIVTTIYQATNQSMEPLVPWPISLSHTWYSTSDRGVHIITLEVDPLYQVTEQDDDNNDHQVTLTVTSRPDLAIRQSTDVWFSDPYPVVNRAFTIYANVWNTGDVNATNVRVSFYELTENRLLGNTTISTVPVNLITASRAYLNVTFTANDTYSIYVAIDELNTIEEVNEDNNNNSLWPRSLRVWGLPGLVITTLEVIEGTNMAVISTGGGTPVPETTNRSMMTLRARIQNQGELFATGVYVDFYDGNAYLGRSINPISSITSGNYAYAVLAWEALTNGMQQNHTIGAIAHDSGTMFSPEVTEPFTVYDNRPDFEITGVALANNATYVTDGNVFNINVTIINNGIGDASDITLQVYASEEDWQATRLLNVQGNQQFRGRLNNTVVSTLNAGQTITLSVRCSSIITGAQELFIIVDPDLNITDTIEYDGITPIIGTIEEYEENNNNATLSVDVIMPQLRINILLPAIGSNIFIEGEQTSILITGLVVRVDNPSLGVEGIPVTIVVGSNAPIIVNSGPGGFFNTNVPITASGNYTVQASGPDINMVQTWFRINPQTSFPWWIIILIVVLVVVVIIGITAYLYFVGLGKTVQCGECGAFIPEGAAKCPKCGVEFETEVAKCSVCGAWVPIDVKNCPECKTEFTVGTEDLDDYEGKMKRQFEDIVRKFREEAKKDLGQEFTETEFQTWWAKQPTFMTFDQWLKEEEEMKRMGSRPCPICQMENSITAKICHKCGSVMGELETPPPKKPEGKMPPGKQEQPKPAPAQAPKQQPTQPAPQQKTPTQQQTAPQPAKAVTPPAQQTAAPTAAAAPPQQQPQPGKKGCPSCGMEVSATDKTCPICSYEFPESGDARRIIKKPIRKIVRRPGEGGGDQGGQQQQ